MTAEQWSRKNAIKAQREAAEESARARSYLWALCVYHPSMVPDKLREAAASAQAAHAQAYEAARSWCKLVIDATVN